MERIEFVAQGSPRVVSRAIEAFAHGQGHVSAIVVPWESTGSTLSMSVTSVWSDGWAIEHTNVGTVTLTDLGDDRTAVRVVDDEREHAEKVQLAEKFDRFARDLQRRFQAP